MEAWSPSMPTLGQPSPIFRLAWDLLVPSVYPYGRPAYLVSYRSIHDVPSWWHPNSIPLDAPCPRDTHPEDWQGVLEVCAGLQLYVRWNYDEPINHHSWMADMVRDCPATPFDVLQILRYNATYLPDQVAEKAPHPRCSAPATWVKDGHMPRLIDNDYDGPRIRGDMPKLRDPFAGLINSLDHGGYASPSLGNDNSYQTGSPEPGEIFESDAGPECEGIEVCCCLVGPVWYIAAGFHTIMDCIQLLSEASVPQGGRTFTAPPPEVRPVLGPLPYSIVEELINDSMPCLGCQYHVFGPNGNEALIMAHAQELYELDLQAARAHAEWNALLHEISGADPSSRRPLQPPTPALYLSRLMRSARYSAASGELARSRDPDAEEESEEDIPGVMNELAKQSGQYLELSCVDSDEE